MAHNAADPTNPCRQCNATVNQTGWTNASAGTSCDDGLWCTGSDTCNASGTCVREFPTGNRCTGGDACLETTCSEQTKTCYKPSTTVCATSSETVCANEGACASVVRTRTVTHYCSGAAPGCPGAGTPGTWQNSQTCASDQSCGNATCSDDVDCVAWCDSETDVCWADFWETGQTFDQAAEYCADGGWAGRSWRVPTFDEWAGVYRGCDDGGRSDVQARSSCTLSADQMTTLDCNSCTELAGPDVADGGCYWATEIDGDCGASYWTSTERDYLYGWHAVPSSGWFFNFNKGSTLLARCVTDMP